MGICVVVGKCLVEQWGCGYEGGGEGGREGRKGGRKKREREEEREGKTVRDRMDCMTIEPRRLLTLTSARHLRAALTS